MADPGRADQGESRDHWVSTTQHAPASSPPPPPPTPRGLLLLLLLLGLLGSRVRERGGSPAAARLE